GDRAQGARGGSRTGRAALPAPAARAAQRRGWRALPRIPTGRETELPHLDLGDGMRVVCFIPARMGASRFPGKVLTPIAGRPMLEHCYRGAAESDLVEKVVIAT